MKVARDQLHVGRVLHQDDNFITVEVAKREDVAFTLDPEKPDHYLTMLFVHKVEDGVEIWKPWESE